jgi:hypothetical protein
LQMLFTYAPPVQHVFRTQGLDLLQWSMIAAAGVLVLLAVEAEKWWMRSRGRTAKA